VKNGSCGLPEASDCVVVVVEAAVSDDAPETSPV
jgi:hypothetical protein